MQCKQKELTASRKEAKSTHTFVITLNEFSVKIKNLIVVCFGVRINNFLYFLGGQVSQFFKVRFSDMFIS